MKTHIKSIWQGYVVSLNPVAVPPPHQERIGMGTRPLGCVRCERWRGEGEMWGGKNGVGRAPAEKPGATPGQRS